MKRNGIIIFAMISVLIFFYTISMAANTKRIELKHFSVQAIDNWIIKQKSNELAFIFPKASFDEICIRIGNSTNKTQKTLDEVWENYKKHISPVDRTILSKENILINNNKWVGEIYTYDLCNTKLKSLHLLTLNNGLVYTLQYISTEKDYDKYLPLFLNAQKTLKLK